MAFSLPLQTQYLTRRRASIFASQPLFQPLRHRLWREILLQQLGHRRLTLSAALLPDDVRKPYVAHARYHAPRKPREKRRHRVHQHRWAARKRGLKSGRSAGHHGTRGASQKIPRAAARPASAKEAGIRVPEETLPHVLISDGMIRENELASAGIRRETLDGFLRAQGVDDAERVLLCELDSRGTVFLQLRGEGQSARRVLWKEAAKCAGA